MIDLYTDGGVIGPNPSSTGGTWAWVTVDQSGSRLQHCSGIVTPSDVLLSAVTNNLTELLAAIIGLEAMLASDTSWSGTLYTDSEVTWHRVRRKRGKPSMNGIPFPLRNRLWTLKAKLGNYKVEMVKGHPSNQELMWGRTKKGTLCSRHNVFVDQLCQQQRAEFFSKVQ